MPRYRAALKLGSTKKGLLLWQRGLWLQHELLLEMCSEPARDLQFFKLKQKLSCKFCDVFSFKSWTYCLWKAGTRNKRREGTQRVGSRMPLLKQWQCKRIALTVESWNFTAGTDRIYTLAFHNLQILLGKWEGWLVAAIAKTGQNAFYIFDNFLEKGIRDYVWLLDSKYFPFHNYWLKPVSKQY